MLLYVDDNQQDLIQRIQSLINNLPEPMKAIITSLEDRLMQEQIEILHDFGLLLLKIPKNILNDWSLNCTTEVKSIDDSCVHSHKSYNKKSLYVDKRRNLMRGNGRMR